MAYPTVNPVMAEARANLYYNPNKGSIQEAIEQHEEERTRFLETELAQLEGETSELEDKNQRNKAQRAQLAKGLETLEKKRSDLQREASELRGEGSVEKDLLKVLGTMQKESSFSNRALLIKQGRRGSDVGPRY